MIRRVLILMRLSSCAVVLRFKTFIQNPNNKQKSHTFFVEKKQNVQAHNFWYARSIRAKSFVGGVALCVNLRGDAFDASFYGGIEYYRL